MKISVILFLFLTSVYGSLAQTSGIKLYEKVMNELSKSELLKLESISTSFENADNLMQEADKMLQNIERINVKFPYAEKKEKKEYSKQAKKLKLKSTENIILSSTIYSQADTLLFSIFKKNIYSIKNKKSKERTLLALRLEKEAIVHSKAARELSLLITRTKLDELVLFKVIAEIKRLETLSIHKLSHIYGIYLRWSEILNYYKVELERVDDANFNFSSDKKSSNSLKLNKDKIVFALQLYSKKQAISKDSLSQLESQYSIVHISIDGSWIIYSVGEYSSYLEALEKATESSFVVAYKNGVSVKIEQAIQETMFR